MLSHVSIYRKVKLFVNFVCQTKKEALAFPCTHTHTHNKMVLLEFFIKESVRDWINQAESGDIRRMIAC